MELNTVTVTLWVSPQSENQFYRELKAVSVLDFVMEYKMKIDDLFVSKSQYGNWLQINIPLELYLIFTYYFLTNYGEYY